MREAHYCLNIKEEFGLIVQKTGLIFKLRNSLFYDNYIIVYVTSVSMLHSTVHGGKVQRNI